MRSEQQMLELIISTALQDARILGAYLAGSRVNPNAPRDIFQDYDVMYVVVETASFRLDKSWIDRFGRRLYMQYPEECGELSPNIEQCYGWLMQFADGNRLDLHVCTLAHLPEALRQDGAYRVLLDKVGCLPSRNKETDADFRIKPFTEKLFFDTCNEFWWCMNNVAKGLWRGELTYAMDMLNLYVRPMLTRLLEFEVGLETGFSVCVGKSAKYMPNWLPAGLWQRYLETYSVAEAEAMWAAALLMCDLVDETARQISQKTGFAYNEIEGKNSRAYLEHVRSLPKDAIAVY